MIKRILKVVVYTVVVLFLSQMTLGAKTVGSHVHDTLTDGWEWGMVHWQNSSLYEKMRGLPLLKKFIAQVPEEGAIKSSAKKLFQKRTAQKNFLKQKVTKEFAEKKTYRPFPKGKTKLKAEAKLHLPLPGEIDEEEQISAFDKESLRRLLP